MFIEILAKSFIWIVYCMLFTLLLKFTGLSPSIEESWFSQYPEIFFIIVALFLMVFSYYTTKGNIHLKVKLMKSKIREYGKLKGISQETLSKELDLSRQTINAIENNKYDPTLTLTFKLAKLFDTTVDELFS